MKTEDRERGRTSPEPNIHAAQRFQERFEFYLVALTFTLLGLAAPTAPFGQLAVADLAELVAWGALLFSGLTGLARLEGIPHFYKLASMRSERLELLMALRRRPGMGEVEFLNETLSVEDALAKQEANVDDSLKLSKIKMLNSSARRGNSEGRSPLASRCSSLHAAYHP